MDFVKALHDWAGRKLHERLVSQWGMTRSCPWCRQIVETNGRHSIRQASHCSFFDTFTCGVCGGESHWEFGPFPLPRGLGSPPTPEQWAVEAGEQVEKWLNPAPTT